MLRGPNQHELVLELDNECVLELSHHGTTLEGRHPRFEWSSALPHPDDHSRRDVEQDESLFLGDTKHIPSKAGDSPMSDARA